jgi:pSer/pThr/pTyr-binding forkhead associated (FHA) protein
VGRASRSDIVLPVPTASKLHACFEYSSTVEFSSVEATIDHRRQRTKPGSPSGWTLTDQGSSNGTFIGNERVTPDLPAILLDGTQIGFGPDIRVRFFTPEGLFGFLALYRLGVVA